MPVRKAFMGVRLRRLREERGLTQAALADALQLSTTYVSQLEKNQRPLTVPVLLKINGVFGVDVQLFSEDEEARLIADLRDALSDAHAGETIAVAELRELVANMPAIGRAFVALHRRCREAVERADTMAARLGDDWAAGTPPAAFEEVRDFFYARHNHIAELDEAADDDVSEIEDLESILDECLGANVPTSNLRWHYRSKHESLIAFSNHRYYGGGLITFPSPVTQDRAVSYVHVADGVYEKGGARVNQHEARAVVQAVVHYLKDPVFQAENLSLGIVTFNSEQQRLIEDLLDERRRADPSIEPFFAEDRLEPVFVKNLENVQGDERDVILFSITYGPDLSGRVSMNFGPLNKQGGERRLNVAITRARRELKVFATLRADQVDLSRTMALGVKDLRHFLEFAERGHRALAEAVSGPVGDHESPFEEAVAAALGRRGWTVHPQIGVSDFRIDLGVVHPDAPGRYLAGVECDGATYHRSATARDRDKLRQHVLTGLGWRILRTWSTDWWTDGATVAEKLHQRLSAVLEADRSVPTKLQQEFPTSAITEADARGNAVDGEAPLAIEEHLDGQDAPEGIAERRYAERAAVVSWPVPPGNDRYAARSDGLYVVADCRNVLADPQPDRFFEPGYRSVLVQMIEHVIAIEGPIKDEVLVRRIARAHGFQRAGNRIREHVLGLVPRGHGRDREDDAVFYWPKGIESGRWEHFRRADGGETRSADEVSLAELAALARELSVDGVADEVLLVSMARELGLRRLHETTRERLATACRVAVEA